MGLICKLAFWSACRNAGCGIAITTYLTVLLFLYFRSHLTWSVCALTSSWPASGPHFKLLAQTSMNTAMMMIMEKQIEFQSSYYTILLFPNYYYYYYYINYTYCILLLLKNSIDFRKIYDLYDDVVIITKKILVNNYYYCSSKKKEKTQT